MTILDAPLRGAPALFAPVSTGARFADAKLLVHPTAVLRLVDDHTDPTVAPSTPAGFIGGRISRGSVLMWVFLAIASTLTLAVIVLLAIFEDSALMQFPNSLAGVIPLTGLALVWLVPVFVHTTAKTRERTWEAWNSQLSQAAAGSGTVQHVWVRTAQDELVESIVWVRTAESDLFIGELGPAPHRRLRTRVEHLPVSGDRVWYWETLAGQTYAQVQRRCMSPVYPSPVQP